MTEETIRPAPVALTMAQIEELERLRLESEAALDRACASRSAVDNVAHENANLVLYAALIPTLPALLSVAREHARIKTEHEAMVNLLLWANQPGHQVFKIGTDNWHAMNADGFLYSEETAEELAQRVGMGKPEGEAENG